MHPYQRSLRKNANQLRGHSDDAAGCLWQKIRRKQILGLSIYRHKILLGYTLDFYCPAAKLAIFLDNGQPPSPESYRADQIRQHRLSELGLYVLHIDRLQILTNVNGVIEEITEAARQRLTPRND